MARWRNVPIATKLFMNIDEAALTRALASVENSYITEADSLSRFPGLKNFTDVADNGRVYLNDWRGDLTAVTSKGRFYRIDKAGTVEDMTGVPVMGGGRAVFAETDKEKLVTAGGQIIKFAGGPTEILSADAPLASHIGVIDGYVVANEINSGRFMHSSAGTPNVWDPLDTFAADGNPDNIRGLMVTQFREVVLAGAKSTEQFERLQSGDIPFFRRWAVGEGLLAPYLMMFADNAALMVNNRYEIVRMSGQTSQPIGDDIKKVLEQVDNWDDAWMGAFPDEPLQVNGQVFILLQIPHATNWYGTKGLTFLYNAKKSHWTTLFGWDSNLGLPRRWPGWSYWPLWGRTFVGGEGTIYEVDLANFTNAGETQRWYVRTAPLNEGGPITVDDLRIRVKRGMGSNTAESKLQVRALRDNVSWSSWVDVPLGRAGQSDFIVTLGGFGSADVFQWEFVATDNVQIELSKVEALVEAMN